MDGLVKWLGEQLDEDERIARVLVDDKRPGRADPWEFCDDGAIRDTSRHHSMRVKFTWAPEAEHIVRHDPARVLREIDAKRRVLARHCAAPVPPGSEWMEAYPYCAAHAYRETGGSIVYPVELKDCPDLRDLATPYADRPGYVEAWRP